MVKIVNKGLLKPVNEITFTNVKRFELSQIEDWFRELKQYESVMKVANDPRFKYSIPAYLCKLFGFNAVTMHLLQDTSINAAVVLNFIGSGMTPSNIPQKVFDLFYDKNNLFPSNLYQTEKVFDARKSAIQIEHGFKINREICPLDADIYLNSGSIVLLEPEELVGMLLHEIGHQFFAFFVDLNHRSHPVSDSQYARANEHFADKFAASYGYSQGLTGFLMKSQANQPEELRNILNQQTGGKRQITVKDYKKPFKVKLPDGTIRTITGIDALKQQLHMIDHPTSLVRVDAVNKSLRYDAEHQKDLTPQERRELWKQIRSNQDKSQLDRITPHSNMKGITKLISNVDREVSNQLDIQGLTNNDEINSLMTSPDISRVPTRDYSYTVTRPSGQTDQYVAIKPHMSTPLRNLQYDNIITSYNQAVQYRGGVQQSNYSPVGDIFRTDGTRVQQDPNTGQFPGINVKAFQPAYYERVRPNNSRQQGIIKRPSVDPRFN